MAAQHDGAGGCVVDGAAGCTLQQTLQAAVQSLQWTYSIFWQLCAQQGVLVWAEGHYNGAIKTRKVVQPVEATAEEACLQRSQQLRELYESLSAGEAGGGEGQQPARRPCAALSPEDLTESEWFFLMCISFFFPPGVGLPGKAFERQQPVWLSGANEVDSKVFSRAILAKGAQIQTVFCIPVADGVVEMGTTDKVEEDQALIHHVRSIFTGHQQSYSVQTTSKPALSEHSSSNPAPSAGRQLFRSPSLPAMAPVPLAAYRYADEEEDEEEEEEEEDEEDEVGEEDDDDGGAESESDSEAADGRDGVGPGGEALVRPCALAMAAGGAEAEAEPSELMQMEMPEDIRLGSPDDYSHNLDADLQMLAACRAATFRPDGAQQRAGAAISPAWPLLHHDCCMLPSSGATAMQTMSQEDAHYSQTVSTIMQHNSGRWVEYSCSTGHPDEPRQSAFSTWSFPPGGEASLLPVPAGTAQCMLKRALRSVPYVVAAGRFKGDGASPKGLKEGEVSQRFRRSGTAAQDEMSASHVLAERRRREKLNERFIVLRSLVPCVTKMDKASILGDTIDYLKQLLRRIQEMEGQIGLMEGEKKVGRQSAAGGPSKKKVRAPAAGGDGDGATPVDEAAAGGETSVQVSIIEADALLELRCPYRDGLLLEILRAVHEVGLETVSVQSSAAAGVFAAEMRAKVRGSVQGKRASIVDVKRALNHVFSERACWP